MKTYRLIKVAREVGIGINILVDFLNSNGYKLIKKPLEKIDGNAYTLIKDNILLLKSQNNFIDYQNQLTDDQHANDVFQSENKDLLVLDRSSEQKKQKRKSKKNKVKAKVNLKFPSKKNDHPLFAYYEKEIFNWDKVSFGTMHLSLTNGLHFPIKLAKKDWNKYLSNVKKVDPDGLVCFLSKRKYSKSIFAIVNLDVILGVAFGILNPDLLSYRRVKIDSISQKELFSIFKERRISDYKLDYFKYLVTKQSDSYPILRVVEIVNHSNSEYMRTRISFIFTVEKESKYDGIFILESLDFDTASHLFSIGGFNDYGYYTTLARLRNYFQSRIENKREKLYLENLEDLFGLNKASTVYHTNFQNWKNKIDLLTK